MILIVCVNGKAFLFFFFVSFIVTQQHMPSPVIVFITQLTHRPTQTVSSAGMQTHRERGLTF